MHQDGVQQDLEWYSSLTYSDPMTTYNFWSTKTNVLFIEMLHLSFTFFLFLLFKRTLIIQTCNNEMKHTFRLVNLFF